MRGILRWYWFHCKRAFDLHEGRAGFWKKRTFKEQMLSVWSFLIMTTMYKLVLLALILLAILVYTLFPNLP